MFVFLTDERTTTGVVGLVSQAVSVFGFAFYIQPVIMPLLEEMPEGRLGVKLTSYSTRVVVLGNAFSLKP
jgi:hypothetical protein